MTLDRFMNTVTLAVLALFGAVCVVTTLSARKHSGLNETD